MSGWTGMPPRLAHDDQFGAPLAQLLDLLVIDRGALHVEERQLSQLS